MTFAQEADFRRQQWHLLALFDLRKSLYEGSQASLVADAEIAFTRKLIRLYEGLKYWSKPSKRTIASRSMEPISRGCNAQP
jgi:hypothetical protein